MYFLYVAEIYFLALLKITCEALIAALIILSLMTIIRYLAKDKAMFTKQLNKLRRYING